jgi:hypothetical protein
MKSAFLLLSFASAVLFTGCATTYQTQQTPDDLYYSPTRVEPAAKEVAKNTNNDDRYEEYISTSDDRYLRMKVANRNRWETLDDYSYWNDSRFDYYGYNYYNNFYGYNYFNNWNNFNNWGFFPNNGFGMGFGNFYGFGYNPYYFGYTNFYNPYNGFYGGFYNPNYWGNNVVHNNNNNGPRRYSSGSNVAAYRNSNYNNYNTPAGNTPARNSNNSSFGGLVRRVIAPPTGSPSGTPSTTVDRPARTFTPSTTPTSNTGGSSGGFGSSGSSSSTPRKPRG